MNEQNEMRAAFEDSAKAAGYNLARDAKDRNEYVFPAAQSGWHGFKLGVQWKELKVALIEGQSFVTDDAIAQWKASRTTSPGAAERVAAWLDQNDKHHFGYDAIETEFGGDFRASDLRALLAENARQQREIARLSAVVCQACNGHGLIGGFVSAESGYHSEPCPDCEARLKATVQPEVVACLMTPVRRPVERFINFGDEAKATELAAIGYFGTEFLIEPLGRIVEAQPAQTRRELIESLTAEDFKSLPQGVLIDLGCKACTVRAKAEAYDITTTAQDEWDFVPQKWTDLYVAVNHMMARLGANGEICARSDDADRVMAALHVFDGGIVCKRALELHEKAHMPIFQATELAVSECGTPTTTAQPVAAQDDRLTALLTRIDDAAENYERFGQVCEFEGQPMIHADTLTEIVTLRGEYHAALAARASLPVVAVPKEVTNALDADDPSELEDVLSSLVHDAADIADSMPEMASNMRVAAKLLRDADAGWQLASLQLTEALAAAPTLPSVQEVPQGYVLALQTAVAMPDGKKELGYTLLDGVGIFTSRDEVSAAIAELSLPIGWVSMTTHQLLPGWMLPTGRPESVQALPDIVPVLPPIEVEDGRTYIPLPGGWEVQTKGKGSTFRLCHVYGPGENDHRRFIVLDEKLHKPLEDMAMAMRAFMAQSRGQK